MEELERKQTECEFCGYETECGAYPDFNRQGERVFVYHCDICANAPVMAFHHRHEQRDLARTICAAANVILDAIKGKANA